MFTHTADRRSALTCLLALGAGAVLTFASPAAAEIQTLRFDMPENLGVFGLVWQTDYFEPRLQGTIAGARLVVQFNTNAGVQPFHDAADILFQHQLPTTTVPFWNVRGSELGWSGTGVFMGSIATDAFNGQSLLDDGDFQLWFGRIVSDNEQQQLLGGRLTNSYWEFDINVVPAPGAALLLGAAGAAWMNRRRRPV